MARKSRVISATGRYHVWITATEEIFSTPEDYEQCLYIMKEYCKDTYICAYSLFPERIHLVLKSPGIPAEFMKSLTIRYTRYKNRRENVTGALFYDRYRSEPLDSDEDFKLCKDFIRHLPSIFKSGDYRIDKDPSPVFNRLFGEEYRTMDNSLAAEFVKAVSGINFSSPSDLDKSAKHDILTAACRDKKLSVRKVSEILEISGAPKSIDNETKPISGKQSKQQMSIWLL